MNDQIANLFDDYNDIPSTSMGHDLLRTIVIPDLLGKETDTVLYFMGRNLARAYPCSTLEEIGTFFGAMGWDQLTLTKEKKHEYEFVLTGDLTSKRLTYKTPYSYKLEAGFLAEQISQLIDNHAECAYTSNNKKKNITFKVVKQ